MSVASDSALVPSLLTLSDVLSSGYHAAGGGGGGVSERTRVTVTGDGAVGLLAVLSARRLNAQSPPGRRARPRPELLAPHDPAREAGRQNPTETRRPPTSLNRTPHNIGYTNAHIHDTEQTEAATPLILDQHTNNGRQLCLQATAAGAKSVAEG
ncbi:hypothetical protein [Streptomyces sp. NPDC088707]|uniref:hypothetical protein n=1 Tax=Streptomyces sp. NPDC088707 TaxID=3365871 RepID=UPI003803969F